MIDKLPYRLTEGVEANAEGIVFSDDALWIKHAFPEHGFRLVTWNDAAECLRYRSGKPGITATHTLRDAVREVVGIPAIGSPLNNPALDEVAFLLIGASVESFDVLHWCVMNFGEEAT